MMMDLGANWHASEKLVTACEFSCNRPAASSALYGYVHDALAQEFQNHMLGARVSGYLSPGRRLRGFIVCCNRGNPKPRNLPEA